MQLSAQEIARATGGQVVGPEVTCDGVSIDTRTVSVGQLFVPLAGVRDGHDFIPGALAAGCGAYLTEREPVGGTAIIVEDTGRALTELGRHARSTFGGTVIGITGSVGKTSVKDLTLAAVGGAKRAHASERSFNNELGVPLTLLNAPDGTEVLIVEMGARGIGHIAHLCDIARPTVGVVTYVGAVHTSEFGTVEAVARAKAELIEALPPHGRAILNADCDPVAAMRSRSAAPVTTYGVRADISATNTRLDDQLRPSFDVVAVGEQFPVTLRVHGIHQVSNALAAIAAAHAVGVDTASAIAGLAGAEVSAWRMQLGHAPNGAVVINDAYNANAISTEAALRSLALLAADRHIAILGTMAELGDRHDDDHQAMTALCDELGISLLPFREPAYGPAPFASFEALMAQVGDLQSGDAVLVKGSRVAGLETLAEQLMGGGE